MAKNLSIGIIGAGPGGLALGIFLRKAGFDDFTIFHCQSCTVRHLVTFTLTATHIRHGNFTGTGYRD